MAKSQKPKTKENPVRTARRVRMVGARVAGETKTAIARAEGLSRAWVAAELNSDESRNLIDGLVKTDLPRLASIHAMALTAIIEAHKADKVIWTPKGQENLGPDHFARLTATKRYLEVTLAGRPTAKSPDTSAKDSPLTVQDLRNYAAGKPIRPAPAAL